MLGPDPELGLDGSIAGNDPELGDLVLEIRTQLLDAGKDLRSKQDPGERDRDLRNDRDIEDPFRPAQGHLDDATRLGDRYCLRECPVRTGSPTHGDLPRNMLRPGFWAGDMVDNFFPGSGMWRDCPAGEIFSLGVLSILSSPLWGMIFVCDRYELIRSPGVLSVVIRHWS